MASSKHYAYYIRGRQLALMQYDATSGDGLNYTAALGDTTDINDIGPSGSARWVSPKEAITDGIEIEYAYSPRYRIQDLDDTAAVTGYTESTGFLKLTSSAAFPTSGVTYVVLSGSERWNGLHKIKTLSDSSNMILETKYNGGTVTETSTLYKDLDVLDDESDVIDLPEYLCKALVYYVKSKLAEDAMDLEQKEYYLREFNRIVEKHESSKVWGARQLGVGPHAIR